MKKRYLLGTLAGAGLGWAVWELAKPGVRSVSRCEPSVTDLTRQHAEGFEAVDAWSAPIQPDETTDPVEWAKAVTSFNGLVEILIRARDLVVRPFGLATATDQEPPPSGFPLIAAGPSEIVCGLDDAHLDFRVGVTTTDGQVTFTTWVRINNTFGQVYWAAVRCFHPWIVRAMLQQARPTSTEANESA
ncbi:MAG: DUF2867 domain-containing protein [Propionibacteriaceae bacterium]|jgi:hypothetical protein|nr:DUF2867 domain-containing protein [Propionibacteriaceae bacterium]